MRLFFVVLFIAFQLCVSANDAQQSVKGRLLNEESKPLPGSVFLDTLFRNFFGMGVNMTRESYNDASLKLTEIPVSDDGHFVVTLPGKRPYIIYFVSPGKLSTGCLLPEYNYESIQLQVNLVTERVKGNSKRSSITSGDPVLDGWFIVKDLEMYTVNDYILKSAEWRIEKGTQEGFSYDLKSYFDKLQQLYNSTDNRQLKNYLLLNLGFLSIGNKFPVDEKYYMELITSLPYNDILWMADALFIRGVVFGLGGVERHPDLVADFVDSLAENLPKIYPDQNAQLYSLIVQLAFEKNNDVFNTFFDKLISNYPESKSAAAAKKKFGDKRKIVMGKGYPAFSVINVDKPGAGITNKDLSGKIWLLDFWATWCGPCINQFPYIEKAYEKYRSKGFEVLSISIDKEMGVINKFRAKRFKMPWLNGYMGSEKSILEKYEVYSVPKMILIDANGNILSVSRTELEGDELEKTLEKYLR